MHKARVVIKGDILIHISQSISQESSLHVTRDGFSAMLGIHVKESTVTFGHWLESIVEINALLHGQGL